MARVRRLLASFAAINTERRHVLITAAGAAGRRLRVGGWRWMEGRWCHSIRPRCVSLRVIVSLERFGGRSVSRRKHTALVFSNIVHRCTNVFSASLSSARRPFITTARLLSLSLSLCKLIHPFFFCSSHTNSRSSPSGRRDSFMLLSPVSPHLTLSHFKTSILTRRQLITAASSPTAVVYHHLHVERTILRTSSTPRP